MKLNDIIRLAERDLATKVLTAVWFKNVHAAMASYLSPLVGSACQKLEYLKGLERDWNAIETKRIGLVDLE